MANKKHPLLKLEEELDSAPIDHSEPIVVVQYLPQNYYIKLSPRMRNAFAWASFILGILAIVASSLVGAGFLSKMQMQISGWLSALFTSLSWVFNRVVSMAKGNE